MENQIQKITLENCEKESSNGEYLFQNTNGNIKFINSQNGSFFEKTIDGWLLIDLEVNDQTYLIDKNFTEIFAAGDTKNFNIKSPSSDSQQAPLLKPIFDLTFF